MLCAVLIALGLTWRPNGWRELPKDLVALDVYAMSRFGHAGGQGGPVRPSSDGGRGDLGRISRRLIVGPIRSDAVAVEIGRARHPRLSLVSRNGRICSWVDHGSSQDLPEVARPRIGG